MTSVFNTILILILASFPLIYFNYDGSDDYSDECSSHMENLGNVIHGITSGHYASVKIHESTEKLHLACTETVDCFEKKTGKESDPGYQEWSKFTRKIKEMCDSLRYNTERYFKCITKFHSNSSTFQNRNTFNNSELTDLEYDGPRGSYEKHYLQE